MPFLNQHSGRLQNPDKFDKDSFRRNDSPIFGKKLPAGVEVIWGKLIGQAKENDPVIPQAIRFPKDKYSVEQAKKWLDDNEIKYIRFEPAKDIKESEDNELVIDLRNCSKEYNNLKAEKEVILSEFEILEDTELILKEMIERGKQKFNPENWKNKSVELYAGIFKKIKKQGIVIPENVEKFLPIEEAKHKRDKCMESTCELKPLYEVLWAEGMGHCWFCENHFKEWATKGDGKGDIVYVKEIKDGKASDKFSENMNPDIWEKLKKNLNFEEGFKIENWTSEILAKENEQELSDRLKGIYELWTIAGAKEYDEEIMNAYQILADELEKRKIKFDRIDEFENMMISSIKVVKENRFIIRGKYINESETIVSEVCTELLIDTGKEYIEKFNLEKDILKESEIPVSINFINIDTPNGKDYKEWMKFEGEIPNKNNGGAKYGNLTESILNIKIKDSGTFEILESEQNFRSIKFNGKLLNGFWIMELRESGWVLIKGKEKEKIMESNSISISGDFVEISGGFKTTNINYNGKVYKLSSTENGKLILTKDSV